MNKTNSSSFKVLALSASVAALLVGCGGSSANIKSNAPSSTPASTFVSQEMNETIRSVERSLQVLVDLERGDEGPRKQTPIGTTVAGAATANAPAVRMPTTALDGTPEGQARIAEARSNTAADLQTKVRLKWTGEADGLLRELSRKVGFDFVISGHGRAPVVHLNHESATVEQVLRDIASQVDSVADVQVRTTERKVTLIFKNSATR